MQPTCTHEHDNYSSVHLIFIYILRSMQLRF